MSFLFHSPNPILSVFLGSKEHRVELPSEMSSDQGPLLAKRGRHGLLAALLLICLAGQTAAQSNYVQHGDSGNYTTNGLPEEATLDGKVSDHSNNTPFARFNALGIAS